jgi:hypothetical protein
MPVAALFAAGGYGQNSQEQNGQPPAGREQSRRGGPADAMHVHGHWVLAVRTLDCTLASRHELENSLVDASLLPSHRAGGNSVGSWEILLTVASGTSPTNTLPECGPVGYSPAL